MFRRRKDRYVEPCERLALGDPLALPASLMHGPEERPSKEALRRERRTNECKKRGCKRRYADEIGWLGCEKCEFWMCPEHSDGVHAHEKKGKHLNPPKTASNDSH